LQVTKKLERDLDKRQRGIESATEDKIGSFGSFRSRKNDPRH